MRVGQRPSPLPPQTHSYGLRPVVLGCLSKCLGPRLVSRDLYGLSINQVTGAVTQ